VSPHPDSVRRAAHDTANWLTAARGHLDRAETLPEGSERRTALSRARRCLDACIALQERLLAGEGPLRRQRVRLADLVRPVAEAFAGTVAPPLRFSVADRPDAFLRVEIDAVRDALLNVLANARRATPEGTIHLEARIEEGAVTIRVRDSGTGMDAATLARCREEGWSGTGSSGLGLAQVQHAVAASAGILDLTSQPGVGTEVSLAFPVLTSGPPRVADVVVVEDDPHVAEVVVEMLRGRGMRVDAAPDAATAWSAVEGGPPRVLLIDQGLPDSTGVELAKRVRQRVGAVGIVLLSGQRLDRDALVPGVADEVLSKPVDFDQLGQVLQDALQRSATPAPHREERGQA